jgi:E3 ubiquitin-protein ligase HUWE1
VLFRCSVALLSVSIDADAVHAVLRLLLRITRKHKFAELFAHAGGVKALLDLSQQQNFQGFFSLTALLLRHILENDYTLKYTMEKVVTKLLFCHSCDKLILLFIA